MSFYRPPAQHPTWDPANLEKHYKKRYYVDRGCIEKLTGSSPGTLSKEEYKQKSLDILERPIMAWKAEAETAVGRINHAAREYVIDRDLALSVLNEKRTKFITCFHLHIPHCVKYSTTRSSIGGLRAKTKNWIKYQENTNRFKQFAEIHHVTATATA